MSHTTKKLNKITLYDFKSDGFGGDFIAQLNTLAHEVHVVLADFDYAGVLQPADLAGADALISRVFDTYPNHMFADSSLRYIGSTHTDVSDFDVRYLKQLGITVTHVPTYCAQTIAELTVGVMLTLARKLPTAFATTKKNQWAFQHLLGFELANKHIGIIGMGQTGKKVSAIAQAIGMQVSYYSRTRKPDIEGASVVYLPLAELAANCDIITIHCPLNDASKQLLDATLVKSIRCGGMVLNSSRAEIIDLPSMYKRCEAAELTLWMDELHDPQWRKEFIGIEQVYLTPDFGWYTIEAQSRLRHKVMQNIQSFVHGDVINQL